MPAPVVSSIQIKRQASDQAAWKVRRWLVRHERRYAYIGHGLGRKSTAICEQIFWDNYLSIISGHTRRQVDNLPEVIGDFYLPGPAPLIAKGLAA